MVSDSSHGSRDAKYHSRSSTEQIELLRKAENRQIIQKVADDTATLRTRSSYAPSRVDSLSVTNKQSSVGGTVFDFDDTVTASLAYRRALQHSRSTPEQDPSVNGSDTSRLNDEGYGSGIAASPNQSFLAAPVQAGGFAMPLRPQDSVFSEHNRSKSVSFQPKSLRPRQGVVQRSQSDSSSKLLGSPGSRIRSVLRRLSTSGRSTGNPASARNSLAGPAVSKKGRRGRENGFSTSIDLISAEGASAPLIVKLAQSGSRFDIERLLEGGHDVEARHIHSRKNALLVAAHCGNGEIVDLLIQSGARLNVADGSGSTALHLAASRGHCEVLALLAAENIDIEAKNSSGRTALWVAADKGQLEATELLIMHHAKINSRADNHMMALHVAAKRGDEEIVDLLTRHGADLEAKDGAMMTALHYACEEGHLQVAEILLQKKANTDVRGSDRRTPLICAAATGNSQIVQLLLKKGAASQISDDATMTALHWAAFNGHSEIVDLLGKKDSLLVSNMAGRTPLHLAVMNSQFATVELILRKKIPLEARCKSGLTPLHYACIANNIEVTKLMLLAGSDIEAQIELDGDQRRPIHIAASCGSVALINLLCEKGASLGARNAARDRALCVACRYGHAAAVQKLLELGSPLYMEFDTGLHQDSPLCLAAMGGHLAVITILVQYGTSVLRKDEMGWQPFHYTIHHGHPSALRHLLSLSPATGAGKGFDFTVRVRFSPDIPDDKKMEVQRLLSLIYSPPSQRFGEATLGFTGTAPQYPSYIPPVEHVNTREVIPQELPVTIEQGLPSSRSATPERMHSYVCNSSVDAGPPGTEVMSRAFDQLPIDRREHRDAPQETSFDIPQPHAHSSHHQPTIRRIPPIGPGYWDLAPSGFQLPPISDEQGYIDPLGPGADSDSDSDSLASVHTAPEGFGTATAIPDTIHELAA